MDRIDQINSERLQWAMDDRGYSAEELARKAGVSLGTLEKAVVGEIGLTFKQLAGVAEAVGRGVLFFLESSPVQEERVHSPQFRTIANQKPDLSGEVKGLVERVGKLRSVYLDLLDDDEDRPRFQPPQLIGKSPEQAAGIARKWLKIDGDKKQDFESYRKAVEAAGVLVFLSNGYQGDWKFPKESEVAGFSLYFTDCPVIAIRKQAFKPRQAFTLMHELGHLLLHRNSFIDEEADLYGRRGREREANAFAGHLLVPDQAIALIDDDARPSDVAEYGGWLKKANRKLGVSSEVILRRLLEAGRLNRESYQAYREYIASLPPAERKPGGNRGRDREPLHMFGDRYVRSVLGAVQARHISLSKASGYLDNLKIPDVHKLEKHIAGL